MGNTYFLVNVLPSEWQCWLVELNNTSKQENGTAPSDADVNITSFDGVR